MSNLEVLVVIAGLTLVTVLTRSFFFLSRRPLLIPDWLHRGLRYAPIAALAAIIAPEVLQTDAGLTLTWKNPMLLATLVAAAYCVWRKGLLGTIVLGMLVYSGLRNLGW